jgi:hypothetical protein
MRRRNLLTEKSSFEYEMTFKSEVSFGTAAWDIDKIDLFLCDNEQDLTDDEQSELESANGKLLFPGSTAADPLNDGQT